MKSKASRSFYKKLVHQLKTVVFFSLERLDTWSVSIYIWLTWLHPVRSPILNVNPTMLFSAIFLVTLRSLTQTTLPSFIWISRDSLRSVSLKVYFSFFFSTEEWVSPSFLRFFFTLSSVENAPVLLLKKNEWWNNYSLCCSFQNLPF